MRLRLLPGLNGTTDLFAGFQRALLYGSQASDEEVAAFQHCMGTIDAKVAARRAQEAARVDVREVFASLKCPVLYLLGRHDKLVRSWNIRGLRRLLPALQIAEFDSPHLILQTQPVQAAAAVAGFLSRAMS